MQISSRLFGEDVAVLSDRNFLLLPAMLAPLSAALISPILDPLTDVFGVSPARIGLLVAAVTAPGIVVVPLMGVLADRYGRKVILVTGTLLFGAAGAAVGATTDFEVTLALRLLQGVGLSGIVPMIITSIGDIYSGTREATAQGIRLTVVVRVLAGTPQDAGVLVAAGSLTFAGAASQAGRITSAFDTSFYPLVGIHVAQTAGFVLLGTGSSLLVGAAGVVLVGGGFGLGSSVYRTIITGLATTWPRPSARSVRASATTARYRNSHLPSGGRSPCARATNCLRRTLGASPGHSDAGAYPREPGLSDGHPVPLAAARLAPGPVQRHAEQHRAPADRVLPPDDLRDAVRRDAHGSSRAETGPGRLAAHGRRRGVAITATTSFDVVLVLRLVQGAGASGVLLGVIAALGDFYSGEAGVTAQGVRMTFHSLGTMVVPVVGGVLIAYGWQYPFFLYAVAIPIAVVVYLTPGIESTAGGALSTDGTTPGASASSQVRALLRIVRQRHVLATVAGMVLPGFFLTAFLTYTSIVVGDVGGTPRQAGVLIALFGLASGVASSQSGRLVSWVDRELTLLLVGNASLAASLVLLGIAEGVVILACSAIAVGVGFGLILSVYRNALAEIAPDHLRGGLTSFGEVANATGLTTPPLVMGFVIDRLAPEFRNVEAIQVTAIAFGLAGGVVGLACAVATFTGAPVEDQSFD